MSSINSHHVLDRSPARQGPVPHPCSRLVVMYGPKILLNIREGVALLGELYRVMTGLERRGAV